MTLEEWFNTTRKEIGGNDIVLKKIIQKINLLSEYATNKNKCLFQQSSRSKGMVLYGKPGTGKTALAMAIAKYSGLPFYVLNSPDIFQTEEGVSEIKLENFFKQAKNHPMSILVLDEIDMISGTSKKSALDRRISSMLMYLIDQLNYPESNHYTFIIAITSRLHSIDSCFLRSGRLDFIQELIIKLPEQRLDILNIISKNLPFKSEKDRENILFNISRVTHGFVPTDLQNLCTQVILFLVNEQMTENDDEELFVNYSHFERALSIVRPSNLNEFASKIPNVRFSDIYGITDVIEEIKTSVIQPFEQPGKYIELGISPPKGILIHGPTGVGKTMLCSALATEAGVNFMLVESSQIRSKIVGESEKSIAKLFAQARANAPCILFIDQIDMLLPTRGTSQSSENTSDRIVTGFLTEMDGLLSKSPEDNNAQIDLLVVAATNRIDVIDPAVLRPGRFDEHIFISLPNEKQRADIIKGISSKMPVSINDSELEMLVQKTVAWSGAQLDNLLREAAMISLRENVDNTKIEMTHILSAFG